MAKSKETYSKKEKEKLKLKKKQAKEEKKEARKANKGQDLDDMIMYVDENGNFSSTPPDPSQKKVIDHTNIQIGISRQEDMEPEDLVRKGKVTFFNESKGYGFIKDSETGENVFVHVKEVAQPIKENDMVSYEVQMSPKGATATDVKKIK